MLPVLHFSKIIFSVFFSLTYLEGINEKHCEFFLFTDRELKKRIKLIVFKINILIFTISTSTA